MKSSKERNMDSMKVDMLIFLALLLATTLTEGLKTTSSQVRLIEFQKQLALINKPAVKSFQTKYGDIVDCVEIYKQLAFDHPLLKNHSIQMKPTNYVSRLVKQSSILTTSQSLLKNMGCPKGTVAIKRVQKEDLKMVKNSPNSFGIDSMSFSSFKYAHPQADDLPEGHQVAYVLAASKNMGVHGNLNVWAVPDVAANQFSSGSIFVGSDDGYLSNGVTAGWSVNSYLYPNNYTRLHTFWTKDSGETTGCFNVLCPGFVQVSQEITLGLVIQPLSTHGGPQYEIELSIEQDSSIGNWWVNFGGKNVGYYPKELFTTLASGATRAGWGGEIASPTNEPTPQMGSGLFPGEGFRKSCYIKQMKLVNTSHSQFFPDKSQIQEYNSKSQCYRASYAGDGGGDTGHFMYFGGPPDCRS